MRERTLIDLEFSTILEEVKSYALSKEGEAQLDNLEFLTREAEIVERQKIIDDFLTLESLRVAKPYRFPELASILAILKIPEKSLDGQELYRLGEYLRSAKAFIDYCQTPRRLPGESAEEALYPAMTLFSPFSASLNTLLMNIEATLDGDGGVKPTHPAIAPLVKQAERHRVERNSYSSEFLKKHPNEAASQIPVYRDARVVLPIRSDQKGAVKGVIHSTSASGATLFIESYRLVELNNQVILAQREIEVAIARLLKVLTKEVRDNLDLIYDLKREVAYGDSLYARGRWVLNNRCVKPLILPTKKLILREARHPLLQAKAVPISLEIDAMIKAVVISGPNAGGKTVTIKTIALFVLLHQSLYYIPASEGSVLPLFKHVFTDIGDEQSITESLSTFSGHMRNISAILRELEGDSLIVLDELGSGTDPVEGAALGRAILEYCVERGGLTLVSSHHTLLKQYAYGDQRLLNMAMEADSQTHQPTFKIIKGVIGESYALETAKRMAIPSQVLDKALTYIGSEAGEISTIIRGLREKEGEFIEREKLLKVKESALQELQRESELKALALSQKEYLLRSEQLGDLSRFISEKRSELENLVARLREGEITKAKTKEVKAYLDSLDEKREEGEKTLKAVKTPQVKGTPPVPFAVGQEVLVKKSRREGTIVRPAGEGQWVVAVGAMKFTLPQEDLEQHISRPKKASISWQTGKYAPLGVIDVRGLSLEEALNEVSHQIEAALVHATQSFSIIHGLGDGILANGIHDYLQTLKFVKKFYFAQPEDGGHGKTYVEF